MIDKQCLYCGFYDSDYECTCPSLDRWYACPLEPEPSIEDFMTEDELKKFGRGGETVGEAHTGAIHGSEGGRTGSEPPDPAGRRSTGEDGRKGICSI